MKRLTLLLLLVGVGGLARAQELPPQPLPQTPPAVEPPPADLHASHPRPPAGMAAELGVTEQQLASAFAKLPPPPAPGHRAPRGQRELNMQVLARELSLPVETVAAVFERLQPAPPDDGKDDAPDQPEPSASPAEPAHPRPDGSRPSPPPPRDGMRPANRQPPVSDARPGIPLAAGIDGRIDQMSKDLAVTPKQFRTAMMSVRPSVTPGHPQTAEQRAADFRSLAQNLNVSTYYLKQVMDKYHVVPGDPVAGPPRH